MRGILALVLLDKEVIEGSPDRISTTKIKADCSLISLARLLALAYLLKVANAM